MGYRCSDDAPLYALIIVGLLLIGVPTFLFAVAKMIF